MDKEKRASESEGEKLSEREKSVHPGAKVIRPKYEPGSPDQPDRWTEKLKSVEEIVRYLKTAERYFCEDPANWYGSEKRKTPA